MKRTVLLYSLLFVLVCALPAAAQQSNFSVTPPPIASPVFEAGKGDVRIGLLYLSIKGQNFKLTGGGLNFIGRQAFSDTWAGDVQVGFIGMSADMGGGNSLSLFNMPFSLNLELQAIKTEHFSAILFAGPNFTLTAGSVDIGTTTASITQTLYGVQGGAQLGIRAGDFMFSPFAMIMQQQGSTTIDTDTTSTTMDIEPYTTKSYGLDIMYTPWGLTLSSVAQKVAEQKMEQQQKEAGYKTQIYQLSWVHQF